MSRKSRPTDAEIVRRLAAVKVMVSGIKDAMPTMVAELRRQTCESIDDIIQDLL